MTSDHTGKPAIPTIDISLFLAEGSTEAERQVVAEKVTEACHTYGFFNLVGHGISSGKLKDTMDCNKSFFNLPEEDKQEVWIGKSLGQSFRGYEPSGIQVHHKGLSPDTKETFMVGREVSLDDPDCGTFSTGPNLWPTSLPKAEFQDKIMDYQAKMLQLVKNILDMLALGLPKSWEAPPNVFDSLLKAPSIPMRFLHYAPVKNVDPNQYGVADHTDFGCVSILLQDPGTIGLEVYHPPTNTWIPVPVIPDGFVINMGDMMQKYTGGYFRSARHRVLTNKENHRHSIAFFLNGNLKLNTKALDGSGSETVVGEHIRQRLIETMGETGKVLKNQAIKV